MNYFDRISKIKEKEEGKNISIKGWVINLNKMGRIIFLKVRDARKSIQVLAKELPVIELVKKLKNGDLIEVYGELKKKQTNLKNRENELR